jgi:hypothetical protein
MSMINMSKDDDNNIDYKLAKKELRDAVLEGDPPFCSFCGKGNNQVKKMVAGSSVYICSECVAEAQRIIDGE